MTPDTNFIDPKTAHSLITSGQALMIDIREDDEHAREHIVASKSIPLQSIPSIDLSEMKDQKVIFYCQSGQRTKQAAKQLIDTQEGTAYLLNGGMKAWKKAGLPVKFDRSETISIMRQVQITAGLFIVLGVLLSQYLSPDFIWLSGFVGAGLMFAGISGTCGLAVVLSIMPWNKKT